jgi:hypothetical protein
VSAGDVAIARVHDYIAVGLSAYDIATFSEPILSAALIDQPRTGTRKQVEGVT